MNNFKYKNIKSIALRIASPEDIEKWSFGEVTKPETINYKSQKPEKDGLFCEKIFGPVKDYECACGKYKKIKNKGVVCDRCGVEITESSVRRERFGHIKLEAPIVHLWMLKTSPGKINSLLDLKTKELEEIIYFVSYVVLDKGTAKHLHVKQILDQKTSREAFLNELRDMLAANTFEVNSEKYNECISYVENLEDTTSYFNFEEIAEFISEHTNARFSIGAEAIYELLQKVDLKKEANQILKAISNQEGDYQKLAKRLDIIQSFLNSANRPEYMVMKVLAVLPPDLRPIIQLDGGRFTTSDINDIYRRIIIRNERIKKLKQMGAPSIIINNEKRMLQEAIDALIDNQRKNKPFLGKDKRPLKSLTDSLKGKQGRFRQNLLGKRVDYSGRSVIVVGPELKMYQCGLPRDMALTLFKPFVVSQLIARGLANNLKIAEKTIQRKTDVVWEILEEVIKGHPVLLNRAPTLHRLGIQAFEIKLVKSKAIHLHPLVTPAFNADFDGDQMAVHLPLSEEAISEAYHLMLGSKNILGLKDGKSIVTPTQDMVLGIYYLTKENEVDVENFRFFNSIETVIQSLETNLIHHSDVIALKIEGLQDKGFNEDDKNCYLITTVGKVIFNNALPKNYTFINNETSLNLNANVYSDVFTFEKNHPFATHVASREELFKFLKNRKPAKPLSKKILSLAISHLHLHFKNETAAALDNIKNLGFKYSTKSSTTISIFDLEFSANQKEDDILAYKQEVLAESDEKVKKLLNLWHKGLLTKAEHHRLVVQEWTSAKDKVQKYLEKYFQSDKVKNNPIFMMMDSGARGNISNFTQLAGMRGLMNNPKGEIIELPIKSSFREGLNVAEYFISTHGARKGMADTALKTADSGYLTRRLVDVAQDVIITEVDCQTTEGFLVKDIIDTKQNTIIVPLIDRITGRFSLNTILDSKNNVIVAENELINEQIASQIINENIHEVEIRSVLRCNSRYGVCQKCYGIHLATGEPVKVGEAVGTIAAQSIGEPGTQLTMRTFHTGGVFGSTDITQGFPRIKELFDVTKPKGKVATISEVNGIVSDIKDHEDGFFSITVEYTHLDETGYETKSERKYRTQYGAVLRVKVGDRVKIGQKLTDGSINLRELLEVSDASEVEKYIIKEVQRVYRIQGIEIADKYIEIIVRQMLNRVVVLNAGDTHLTPGVKLTLQELKEINQNMFAQKKVPAYAIPLLLGIKKAPLETNSFLSAASFQDTTRVLALAAVKHKVDELRGLKENVIIGSLIPSGTSELSSEEIITLGQKVRSEFY